MYPKYCILFLGLVLLGDSVLTKGYNEQAEYGDKTERPWLDDDDIFIDDGDEELGQDRSDDEDSYEASGSFEGSGSETEGSADGPTGPLTRCEQVREELRRQHVGAYIPRCRENGEFESEQCNYMSGECWCVTPRGDRIPDTMRRTPHRPNCNGEGPVRVPTRRPPRGPGADSEEINIDESEENNEVPENPSGGSSKDDNVIDAIPPDIETAENDHEHQYGSDESDPDAEPIKAGSIIGEPGILAGIIGGAVVGLLCAVLLVMFIVYRMRKKDEGSYALDEPKRSPQLGYTRARDREFFA